MTRYHVATAGECEAVRQAINAGWRAGPAAYAEHHLRDGTIALEPIAAWEARTGAFVAGRTVGSSGPLPPYRLIVAGSDAVLELPEDGINGQLISEQLGVGIVPAANQLAQVDRARDHSQFVTGIRDKLDDNYADTTYGEERAKIGAQHANQAAADAQARVALIAELQGQRANNTIARKEARDAGQQGAQAIERALGLGRRE